MPRGSGLGPANGRPIGAKFAGPLGLVLSRGWDGRAWQAWMRPELWRGGGWRGTTSWSCCRKAVQPPKCAPHVQCRPARRRRPWVAAAAAGQVGVRGSWTRPTMADSATGGTRYLLRGDKLLELLPFGELFLLPLDFARSRLVVGLCLIPPQRECSIHRHELSQPTRSRTPSRAGHEVGSAREPAPLERAVCGVRRARRP